jgi:hypothetical protein
MQVGYKALRDAWHQSDYSPLRRSWPSVPDHNNVMNLLSYFFPGITSRKLKSWGHHGGMGKGRSREGELKDDIMMI